DHMIDRQLFGAGLATAILTRRMIALKQVPARERYCLVPSPIVTCQGKNFRNPQMKPYSSNEGLTIARRKFGPIRPAIKLKIVRIDYKRGLIPQQHQCTRHGGDVHWLPMPV